MSKFKVRFKVAKLEFDIEGERESIPDATQAIQKHLSALLMAPSVLAGGSANGGGQEKVITEAVDVTSHRRGKRRSSSPRSSSRTNGEVKDAAIDFKHDPEKWGNPLQGWSTSKKAMWLLFVAKNQFDLKEMSSNAIADTFNKHFRSAGTIKSFTVARDLGRHKSKSPAWIGEDTTQTPSAWYLVGEGENVARKLVADATGTSQAPTA